jgi:23S rRNA (cytosine1962-C5)-methyltransferase
MSEYTLLDSGHEHKFEKFGKFTLVRPCSQAVWQPTLDRKEWDNADAIFTREPVNKWKLKTKLPASWIVTCNGIKFKLVPTDFGHLGIFPEHASLWSWMVPRVHKGANILNLFAYTGGATMSLAKAGAKVCHLDASKTVVAWARENAELNDLQKAEIRWIVDDASKFLQREVRRGVVYDGILLDPPTFGRGNSGEIFKIERDLFNILELCRKLLSPKPLFFILSSHTPGYTPLVMHHLLRQVTEGLKGTIDSGEMVIPGKLDLPSGTFARWHG